MNVKNKITGVVIPVGACEADLWPMPLNVNDLRNTAMTLGDAAPRVLGRLVHETPFTAKWASYRELYDELRELTDNVVAVLEVTQDD